VFDRILKEMENAGGLPTLTELSRRLDIERSALEDMVQFLVRKGKLREIRPDMPACSHCGSSSTCSAGQLTTLMGTTYEVVKPTQR
jgi:hypothetical protein